MAYSLKIEGELYKHFGGLQKAVASEVINIF